MQEYMEKLKKFCINFDYFDQYDTIMKKGYAGDKSIHTLRKIARKNAVYSEVHHILPKSLGGDDSPENIVMLEGKDHFICHWLLYKMTKTSEMTFAFNQMKRYIKKAKSDDVSELKMLYEDAREDISNSLSKMAKLSHENKSPEQKAKESDMASKRTKGSVVVLFKDTGIMKKIKKEEFNSEIHDYPQRGTKKSEECKRIMKEKAQVEYRGIPFNNPLTGEIKYFKEGTQPEGWISGSGIQNVHTKGTVFYHDPITKECIRCPEGTQPDGWISGRYKFNNHFTGKIITKHIITGETGDPTNPKPLYVDIKSKGIYTYTDLNGVRKATGASSRIISDLNFDWEYFMSAMRDPNRLITHQTRSNGLNKTHKGQHIKDVYSITFYPKESLTQEICDKILSECEWIR